MAHLELDIVDCKVISCNKFQPKSDYHCINLYPEGDLSNGMRFKDIGECMALYDESGNFKKMLYHQSEIKKEIMKQYHEWK